MSDADEELAEMRNKLGELQGELEEARSLAAFWQYQAQGAAPCVDAILAMKRLFKIPGCAIPADEILERVQLQADDLALWKNLAEEAAKGSNVAEPNQ